MAQDPLIGRQLAGGRYIIEGLLSASGGMAIIYYARRVHLDDLVALKVLRDPTNPERLEEYKMRFEREARAAAKLSDHPNIVDIYDFGIEDNTAFIAMPILTGGSLQSRLYNYMAEDEILDILKQIASALDYAASRGVIHRDIKPDNILFDEHNMVRITDFGIAKLTNPLEVAITSSGQAMGTPLYMPPEQWNGKTSPSTDQYSLAVIAYQLFTQGNYIFDFEGEITYTTLLNKHLYEAPVAIDARKPELAGIADIINQALHKDPAQRFPSATSFVNALGLAFHPASPSWQPLSPPTRSLLWSIWLVASVVVLLLGVMSVLLLLDSGNDDSEESETPNTGFVVVVPTESPTEVLNDTLKSLSPTEAASSTMVASPTMNLSPTYTPTATASPTLRSTNTASYTATATRRPTDTPSLGSTTRPTNTSVPSPTATASQQQLLPTNAPGMVYIVGQNGASDFQIEARLRGRTDDWSEARANCITNGMTLQSSDEWLAAFNSGLAEFEVASDIEEWTRDTVGDDQYVVLLKDSENGTRITPNIDDSGAVRPPGYRCVLLGSGSG